MPKKICLVEDNKAINKLFSTLLKKANYEVTSFPSGHETLEWIKNNKADIFVLDFLLPDMTGKEVMNAIRENEDNKTAKIIAVTGFTTDKNIDIDPDTGFDKCLSKPVDTNAFMDTVAKLIG